MPRLGPLDGSAEAGAWGPSGRLSARSRPPGRSLWTAQPEAERLGPSGRVAFSLCGVPRMSSPSFTLLCRLLPGLSRRVCLRRFCQMGRLATEWSTRAVPLSCLETTMCIVSQRQACGDASSRWTVLVMFLRSLGMFHRRFLRMILKVL